MGRRSVVHTSGKEEADHAQIRARRRLDAHTSSGPSFSVGGGVLALLQLVWPGTQAAGAHDRALHVLRVPFFDGRCPVSCRPPLMDTVAAAWGATVWTRRRQARLDSLAQAFYIFFKSVNAGWVDPTVYLP